VGVAAAATRFDGSSPVVWEFCDGLTSILSRFGLSEAYKELRGGGAVAITSTAVDNEEELRVVHALRLKSFADTDVVAEAAGVSPERAKQVLDGLADAERVKYREGRMTGWMLLPAGRAHGEALLAQQLDDAGRRAQLDAIYRRFLEHNQPFLGLCTDWQVRMIDGAQVSNDHGDAEYDAMIIGRLAEADASMQPICADLGALFQRFEHYAPSFAEALAKVQSGELEWFTKPMIESYHTIWFELHEDLLASLGIDRAKEGHA